MDRAQIQKMDKTGHHPEDDGAVTAELVGGASELSPHLMH